MNVREEIVEKIQQINESRLPELYKVVEKLADHSRKKDS